MKVNLLVVIRNGLILSILLMSLSTWFITSSGQLRINKSEDPGSMFPVMMEGDAMIVIRVDPKTIDVGDIIVFQIFTENINFQDTDDYIIHRVQAVKQVEGKYYFLTKGDNHVSNSNLDTPGLSNEEIDSTLGNFIPESQVFGKVYYRFSTLASSFLYNLQENTSFRALLIAIVLILLAVIFVFGNKIEEALNKSFLNREISFTFFTHSKESNSEAETSDTTAKSKDRRFKTKTNLIVIIIIAIILFTQLYPLYIFRNMTVSESQVKDIQLSRQDNRFSVIKGETIPYTTYRLFLSIDVAYKLFTRLDIVEIKMIDSDTNIEVSSGLWSPNVGVWSPNGQVQGEFNFSLIMVIMDDKLPTTDTQLNVEVNLAFKSIFRSLEIGAKLETPVAYEANPYLP